ncbi:hypothetical protein SDC9_95733 [bioreactor metagenome]|uniref:Uncharacterized protein n=1 Tax=bioreactor metagenome TaxID=1076179 RepID=A0A645A739_9ZZZZ
MKYVGIILRGSAAHSFDTSKSKLIVGLALLVVAEHFIGLGRFLELFLCKILKRVVFVHVRVVLFCKLPIGAFYFIL